MKAQDNMPLPKSCDTFVVMPNLTKHGKVIFGKNSDRPQNEVQEVVCIGRGTRDTKLKCTYISIDESPKIVNSVILSKPAWMWGAEMGSNDKNVVIGNEAVWTNNNEGNGDARQKRLLGMDLVRLGLERGDTALEALEVIITLLEKYGQGGPCSEFDDSLIYHNSFLIADPLEAWVLETSGTLWAAEKIEKGYRNISNGLTITTNINKHSENLHEKAKDMGLWDGQSEFNFKKCFSAGGDIVRQQEGVKLLKEHTAKATFDVHNMFAILRDKESGICRACDDSFPTQGSQVSVLSSTGVNIHWFTATPDPSVSYFKPFIFTPGVQVSTYTASPDEPLREHHLYKLHSNFVLGGNTKNTVRLLQDEENRFLKDIAFFYQDFKNNRLPLDDFKDLMKKAVQVEINLLSRR
ncbi:secernin-3 isoform X1 [Plodia interpunctella]|uniref:secernin-3 isoform X1 n=1 Tax=Plodia interpunctella TaxID=58824 RepID=UPI0023686D9E|nr:secernin-3 isoform X1 [Plodia interpunctella]